MKAHGIAPTAPSGRGTPGPTAAKRERPEAAKKRKLDHFSSDVGGGATDDDAGGSGVKAEVSEDGSVNSAVKQEDPIDFGSPERDCDVPGRGTSGDKAFNGPFRPINGLGGPVPHFSRPSTPANGAATPDTEAALDQTVGMTGSDCVILREQPSPGQRAEGAILVPE